MNCTTSINNRPSTSKTIHIGKGLENKYKLQTLHKQNPPYRKKVWTTSINPTGTSAKHAAARRIGHDLHTAKR